VEQEATGQAATTTVGQAVTQSAQPTTRKTRTTAPAKRTSRTGTPNGHGSAAGADAATVNISLPKECYEYFAAEAEKDERTLAQFLRRTLRDVWQGQVAARGAIGQAAQPAQPAQTAAQYAAQQTAYDASNR
jgi:hypothetical protein